MLENCSRAAGSVAGWRQRRQPSPTPLRGAPLARHGSSPRPHGPGAAHLYVHHNYGSLNAVETHNGHLHQCHAALVPEDHRLPTAHKSRRDGPRHGTRSAIKHRYECIHHTPHTYRRHSVIHLFTDSFNHPFMHSFIDALIHSLVHSYIHWCIQALMQAFVHSTIHPFIQPFIHPFIHLFIHSFIHLFIHSCIN